MPKKVVLFGVGLTSAAVLAVGTWGMVTLLKVNAPDGQSIFVGKANKRISKYKKRKRGKKQV